MPKDSLSRKKSAIADEADGLSFDASELTEKQKIFVQSFVAGKTAGNASKAAIAAGYSERTAGQIACATLKLPHVQTAIDAALRVELSGALTTQAIKVIRTILLDDNAPLKLRGEMACKVVEFSGIVERVRLEKGRETGLDQAQTAPKRLGELTRVELENMVRTGADLLKAAAALPPAGPVIDGDNPKDFRSNQPDGLSSLMVTKA